MGEEASLICQYFNRDFFICLNLLGLRRENGRNIEIISYKCLSTDDIIIFYGYMNYIEC